MKSEVFRGDFAELAATMQDAWSLNREPALLYTEQFLRSAFEYPGAGFELTAAIYERDRLAAFCAAFPRQALLGGRETRLSVNTFLTAASHRRGSGVGIVVWGETLRRLRDCGFEGSVNFCVEGDDMQRIMPVASKFFGLKTKQILRVEYLSRMLRPVKENAPEPVTDSEIRMFVELAGEYRQSAPLARTWTLEEAVWQCRAREGSIAVCHSSTGGRGFLTGCAMQVTGTPPVTVALMEDLFWGTLDASGREQLLRKFLVAAASGGAVSVSCPAFGYSSLEPLAAAGFRKSKRVLHAWLTLWNGCEPAELPAMYFDVV